MSTSAESVAETMQDRPAGSRFGRGALVDGIVILMVGATVAYWVHSSRRLWFFSDDWWLAAQVVHPKGLLQPYNGNMSLVILVIYRVLLGIFGLSTYLPYRITAMVSLGSVSATMYFTIRGRIGRPLAVVAASVLLWPSVMDLAPSALNHYLGLSAGIGCAYLLNRPEGRRQNLLLCAALLFALACASGGTTIALGCFVFCSCTRPTWRRWASVIGPIVLWGVWWLVLARNHGYGARVSLGFTTKVRFLGDAVWQSLPGFTGGEAWIAGVVIALVCLRAVQVLRHGFDESANLIAWLAAATSWWVALVWQRGDYARQDIFRYQLFSAVMVILAVMPRHRVVWPTWVQRVADKPKLALGAVVPVVVAVLLTGSSAPAVRVNGYFLGYYSQQARQSSALANIEPPLLPDDAPIAGYVQLHTVRAVMRAWGGVTTDPVAKQQAVLDFIMIDPVASVASRCADLPPRFDRPRNIFTLILSAGNVPVLVRMAAGDGDPLPKVTIPAHSAVRFTFPLTTATVKFVFTTSPIGAVVTGRSVDSHLRSSCMSG